MLIISPRSYVTAAFDQLFPTLLEHVFEVLSPMNNWWEDLVFGNKTDLFIKEIRSKITEDDIPEHYAVLFDYFDEHSLCILVVDYARKHFSDDDYEWYKKLLVIRNEWAHRNYGKTYREAVVYDDEESKRVWAISKISVIKKAAEYFNKSDIAEDISILLFKMRCDWIGINDDVNLPAYNKLLDWLYENVVEKVIDDTSPVSGEVKDRVNSSFNNLVEFVSGPSKSNSKSMYIIDFYWNAIKAKTDVYNEIRKHVGIPSFESVVEEFTEFCYGSYDSGC